MIKSLIKLAIILVVGILVYNYFFGTPEEQQQSKEIFTEVKDLTRSAFNLLRTEKQKFDEGKYDDAVEKVGGLLENMKGKAKTLKDNKGLLDQIAELQQRQRGLDAKLNSPGMQQYDKDGRGVIADSADRKEVEREWEDLIRQTERLMREMEKQAEREAGQ